MPQMWIKNYEYSIVMIPVEMALIFKISQLFNDSEVIMSEIALIWALKQEKKKYVKKILVAFYKNTNQKYQCTSRFYPRLLRNLLATTFICL